ncbi:hypothetical protein DFH09DRAFT_1086408 [Mycena vulgaris]|nr:hypothetical protein DFH09DRAFT_1086408 [Mycena vulgaris]
MPFQYIHPQQKKLLPTIKRTVPNKWNSEFMIIVVMPKSAGLCCDESASLLRFQYGQLLPAAKRGKSRHPWSSANGGIRVSSALENEERTPGVQFDEGWSPAIGTEVGTVGMKPLA